MPAPTLVVGLVTADGPRSYRIHVPPSYTGTDAVPLVFNMHGATSSSMAQEIYTRFSVKADAEGFIVVYPDGLTTALVTYTHFNAFQAPSPEPNDLAFLTGLLDTMEAQLCIDPSRVYSTGISNGAMMSVRLACSLSSRIAAIAPVAGAYYPPDALNLNPNETCPDSTAVPVIAFHGTADAVVPFNSGLGGVNGLINFRLPIDNDTPAEDVLADWAVHNVCTLPRQETQIDTEVRLIQYDSCSRGATVELYAVDGGGHTWPGLFDVPSLGYTTHQIIATDLIWSFFAAHPLMPLSVGGVAEAPAPAPSASIGASADNGHDGKLALGGTLLAAVAAAGVAGWIVRRRRWSRER